MAARTTPRAAALVAARLLRGAATADARHVPRPSCGRVTRAARPFASDSARGALVARPRALPAGSALRAHPLMRQRTGRYSIDDFALVVDEVRLGDGMPTAKIVRPSSEDAVLDMYVELGLLDHDPYWAALWPSSVALARGVAERAQGEEGGDLRGKSVCDMGAGLGLAGIAAALCGAESVAFYDREPLALQCCLLSAEANGLRVAFGNETGLRVIADEEAVEDEDAVYVNDKGGQKKKTNTCVVSASVFDWNAVPLDQDRFDLVLACDVLYETHAVKPVASLVPKLTKEKTGVWLVADPPLRAPKNRARFVELVEAFDFSLSRTRETTTTHGGSTDTVLLLEFEAK
jgi:ETFB lysine methyltransferase